MKKFIFSFCCCLLGWGTADVFAQQGFVATGGDAAGTGGSASYSVGQVSYSSASDVNKNIIEGNQQPYEISTEVKEISSGPASSLYPNPTSKNVTLKIENGQWQNLTYMLYDDQGKLLLINKVEAEQTDIGLSQFAASKYFLKLTDDKTELKTFKIVKLY